MKLPRRNCVPRVVVVVLSPVISYSASTLRTPEGNREADKRVLTLDNKKVRLRRMRKGGDK
jgi:hypothetical protein